MSLSRTASLTAILVLSACHLIWSQQRWNPLWYDFNNAVVVRTYYGDVRGFSVPWDIEDTVWHRELHEYPPWYLRRVNCFLGVPFALPPLGYLRFRVSIKLHRSGGHASDALCILFIDHLFIIITFVYFLYVNLINSSS